MISLLLILLLTILQAFCGFGVLSLFRIYLKLGICILLSILLGAAIFSWVPFLLQLFFIPVTARFVFLGLLLACILLNLKLRENLVRFIKDCKQVQFKLKIYEIPFLFVICFILFVSAWRCFYLPPTPRDLTSGAEAIAEFAVKEKTMINSVFYVNAQNNNNPYKSPFISSLQIIYKYAGFPFGQIWLTTIVVCFAFFLYKVLCENIHRLLAGFVLVAFFAIPEMYAYTFMVLFDYSNAVFFCLAVFFLVQHFQNPQKTLFFFSAFLMGQATYIRAETLVLAFFIVPAVAVNIFRHKKKMKEIFLYSVYYIIPSVAVYLVTLLLYNKVYLPIPYVVENLVNEHPFHLSTFFDRFAEINSILIFSKYGLDLYGYFFYLFLIVLLADSFIYRKWTLAGRNYLYAVLVLYIGIPFLGHLLPLMDLENTTKRALFKIFPVMLLYLGDNYLLINLSKKIVNWEERNL